MLVLRGMVDNPVDRLMLGPDLLKEIELTVKQVQSNLKMHRIDKRVMQTLKELRKNSK